MSSFYENYVKLCTQIGKSPSGVALEIGLSKTAVNGWKKKRSNPTDATLLRIVDYFSNYFDVTIEDLLGENENKPAPVLGNELDIKELINNMSREELVDFIMMASARLRDMD